MWQLFLDPNARGADIVLYLGAFVVGLVLSPFSWGFLYFLIFLFVSEFLTAVSTQMAEDKWRLEIRVGIVGASFLGFIGGRSIIGDTAPLSLDANPVPPSPVIARIRRDKIRLKKRKQKMLREQNREYCCKPPR